MRSGPDAAEHMRSGPDAAAEVPPAAEISHIHSGDQLR